METWYKTRFSKHMVDEIADNTSRFDTQDVRLAAKDAEYLYLNNTFGCTIEWMTTVQMKLNNALRARGESPV